MEETAHGSKAPDAVDGAREGLFRQISLGIGLKRQTQGIFLVIDEVAPFWLEISMMTSRAELEPTSMIPIRFILFLLWKFVFLFLYTSSTL